QHRAFGLTEAGTGNERRGERAADERTASEFHAVLHWSASPRAARAILPRCCGIRQPMTTAFWTPACQQFDWTVLETCADSRRSHLLRRPLRFRRRPGQWARPSIRRSAA